MFRMMAPVIVIISPTRSPLALSALSIILHPSIAARILEKMSANQDIGSNNYKRH